MICIFVSLESSSANSPGLEYVDHMLELSCDSSEDVVSFARL